MSTVTYKPPAPAFLELIGGSSPIFKQNGPDPNHYVIRDQSTRTLLGSVDVTLAGGKLTALEFSNAKGEVCGTATGLNADALSFATDLNQADNNEERYKLFVALIDDATTVTGSAGNDIIETGAGRDTVNAGLGDDDIAKWKGGNLKLDGGAGFDTLSFQARTGTAYPIQFKQVLDIDLRGRPGLNPYGGTLSVTKVENVIGTSRADRIAGNDNPNRIGDGVFDGGPDTINALGGDDVVFLSRRSAGANVSGGNGRDELRFDIDTSATGGTVLDLLAPNANAGAFKGSVAGGFEVYTVFTPDVTAASFTFRGSNNGETVTGSVFAPGATIENGKDTLIGRGGADILSGLSGKDFLDGGTGRDELNGGAGIDYLRGGESGDEMTGGLGADTFDFNTVAEIGKTAGSRDIVTDFSHAQKDRLDLHGIDADSGVAGNQDFRFIGAAAFGGNAGELHYVRQNVAGTANDRTIVEGDIDGNGTADFRLELGGLLTLFRGDFIL